MRGDPGTVTVLRPARPAEALRLLARRPEALPLAGGTDLMVAWNMGGLNGRCVLDLSRLAEWKRIRVGHETEIGALATHADIQRHRALSRRFPLLVSASAVVGAAQIQNRGTIGGNIANASPAGDTFPALAVYDARVRVASSSGARVVPFLDIFAGAKKTTLGPGEMIAAVELPTPPPGARGFFRKVGTRAAQAISKTVGAGLLWRGPGKTVRDLRLAFGSVAPTVVRLRNMERSLIGKELTEVAIEQALSLLDRDIAPIDDIRSTREYRIEATRNIVRRFLQDNA